MDLKVFGTVFISIFIAELGDKTQLATFSFAAADKSKLAVFLAATAALALATLMGVFFRGIVQRTIPVQYVKMGAGRITPLIVYYLQFISFFCQPEDGLDEVFTGGA